MILVTEMYHIGRIEEDLKENYKYRLFGLRRNPMRQLEVTNVDSMRVSSRIYEYTTRPLNIIPIRRNIQLGLKDKMRYQNKLNHLLSLGY